MILAVENYCTFSAAHITTSQRKLRANQETFFFGYKAEQVSAAPLHLVYVLVVTHDRSRASGDHLALCTLAYNERLNEGDWGQEHVPSALGAQQTDPGIWDRMKGQRIC